MACCWRPGFNSNIVDPESWSNTSGGWFDLTDNLQPFVIFSGIPDWLTGEQGLLAWRIYADAMARFTTSYAAYHHHGEIDAPNYLRTFAGEKFGGTAPVAVFVVPDYYLNFVQLQYRNKFVWSSALDYTGDVNTDIPQQLMSHPFFTEWRRWRDQEPGRGVPPQHLPDGSISDDDIDINLSYVYFEDLRLAGGYYFHISTFLTTYGGRLVTAMNGEVPRIDPDLSGFVTPVVIVSRSQWLADIGVSGQGIDKTIAGYAFSATPGPNIDDMTILDGFNRIYPNDEDPQVRMYLNRERVEWTLSDFEDEQSTNRLQGMLDYSPVQEYSAPSEFQAPVEQITMETM